MVLYKLLLTNISAAVLGSGNGYDMKKSFIHQTAARGILLDFIIANKVETHWRRPTPTIYYTTPQNIKHDV